jgi:Ca2+-transporting ATPase
MNKGRWLEVTVYGLIITTAVLGAMAIALRYLGMTEKEAVTVSFLTLAFAQLWHVFNMRDKNSTFLGNAIIRNSFVWGALGLCTLLLAATVYVPLLAEVLDIARPSVNGWLLIFSMSLLPLVAGQIGLAVLKEKGKM